MKTYIALFRGINVGGKNILPMKDLAMILDEHGCKDIKTYIQSGNVVFRREQRPGDEISLSIEKKFGFKPDLFIISKEDFDQAIENNPFKTEEGKALHFFFCKNKPGTPDLEMLEELKIESEEFNLSGKVFYLYAPNGIGRSKLATKIETCMGVSVTARNWNTIKKLADIVQNV